MEHARTLRVVTKKLAQPQVFMIVRVPLDGCIIGTRKIAVTRWELLTFAGRLNNRQSLPIPPYLFTGQYVTAGRLHYRQGLTL